MHHIEKKNIRCFFKRTSLVRVGGKVSTFSLRRTSNKLGLTSHVNVSGPAHVASGEDDQVQDIADDSQATDGRQNDAVADPPEGRGPRVLQDLQIPRQETYPRGLRRVGRVDHLAPPLLAPFPSSFLTFTPAPIPN